MRDDDGDKLCLLFNIDICDAVHYTIGKAVTCGAHVDGISWLS